MKTTKIATILSLLFVTSLSFTSCEKDDPQAPEVEIAEDDALASDLFDDVYAEVEDAMESMEDALYDGNLKSASAVTCKTISVEHPDDSTYWPRTVTVDYGEGCTGPDGRTRKGKIIMVVNERYISENYYRTVTFDNFYIDEYKIEGERTVRNEGFNENGNLSFSVVLTGGKVISPEGKEMSREYTRTREWIAGMETPRLRWDDEYLVTGAATGVNRNQVAYTHTIVTPLHIARACRWILSGTVELEAEERETATLDYGDGICDRLASVTVGDKTWTIRLHP